MTVQEFYDLIEDKNLTIKIYDGSDSDYLYEPTPEDIAEYFHEVVIY